MVSVYLSLLSEAWRKQPFYRIYLLLLLAAFVKQIISPAMLVDSREYLNAANNLYHFGVADACHPGNDFCGLILHQTRRTMGYPLILISSYFVQITWLLQVLLAALIPVTGLGILRGFSISEKAERWYFLLWLLYPLQYFYAAMVMPELWVQWMVLSAVLAWTGNRRWLLPLLLAVLVLLKPVFLPAVYLSPLLLFFIPGYRKWLALLPLTLVLLVSARNKQVTGLFHYSSIGVVNAYEYNVRAVMKTAGVSPDSFYAAGDRVMMRMDFREKYQYMGKQTKDVLMKYPLHYALRHTAGAALALFDPGRYDLVAFLGMSSGSGFMGIKENGGLSALFRQHPLVLVYLFVFGMLALLKVILTLMAARNWGRSLWPLLIPVLYILALTGPVGSARYIMPVAPLLIIMSAMTLGNLRIKGGRT